MNTLQRTSQKYTGSSFRKSTQPGNLQCNKFVARVRSFFVGLGLWRPKPWPNGLTSWCKSMQVFNLHSTFGHPLMCTCDDLHWLWSTSNPYASGHKFLTVWPPNASQDTRPGFADQLHWLVSLFGQGLRPRRKWVLFFFLTAPPLHAKLLRPSSEKSLVHLFSN